MSKIDVKEIITSVLRQAKADEWIKKSSTDYPSTWVFPIAIYRTADKPHAVDFEKNELQTEWKITIEVFGNENSSDIANELVKRISELGFKGDCKDANTADKKRVICDFIGIVDNVTRYVFHKN